MAVTYKFVWAVFCAREVIGCMKGSGGRGGASSFFSCLSAALLGVLSLGTVQVVQMSRSDLPDLSIQSGSKPLPKSGRRSVVGLVATPSSVQPSDSSNPPMHVVAVPSLLPPSRSVSVASAASKPPVVQPAWLSDDHEDHDEPRSPTTPAFSEYPQPSQAGDPSEPRDEAGAALPAQQDGEAAPEEDDILSAIGIGEARRQNTLVTSPSVSHPNAAPSYSGEAERQLNMDLEQLEKDLREAASRVASLEAKAAQQSEERRSKLETKKQVANEERAKASARMQESAQSKVSRASAISRECAEQIVELRGSYGAQERAKLSSLQQDLQKELNVESRELEKLHDLRELLKQGTSREGIAVAVDDERTLDGKLDLCAAFVTKHIRSCRDRLTSSISTIVQAEVATAMANVWSRRMKDHQASVDERAAHLREFRDSALQSFNEFVRERAEQRSSVQESIRSRNLQLKKDLQDAATKRTSEWMTTWSGAIAQRQRELDAQYDQSLVRLIERGAIVRKDDARAVRAAIDQATSRETAELGITQHLWEDEYHSLQLRLEKELQVAMTLSAANRAEVQSATLTAFVAKELCERIQQYEQGLQKTIAATTAHASDPHTVADQQLLREREGVISELEACVKAERSRCDECRIRVSQLVDQFEVSLKTLKNVREDMKLRVTSETERSIQAQLMWEKELRAIFVDTPRMCCETEKAFLEAAEAASGSVKSFGQKAKEMLARYNDGHKAASSADAALADHSMGVAHALEGLLTRALAINDASEAIHAKSAKLLEEAAQLSAEKRVLDADQARFAKDCTRLRTLTAEMEEASKKTAQTRAAQYQVMKMADLKRDELAKEQGKLTLMQGEARQEQENLARGERRLNSWACAFALAGGRRKDDEPPKPKASGILATPNLPAAPAPRNMEAHVPMRDRGESGSSSSPYMADDSATASANLATNARRFALPLTENTQ